VLTLKGKSLFKCLNYNMIFKSTYFISVPLITSSAFIFTLQTYSRFLMTLSLTLHKSFLWPCHVRTETCLTLQGRRRQISCFFSLNQSIKFLSGKVDVDYEINSKDDASHSKIPECYKWKGPKIITNEERYNSSGLERSRNY